MAADISSSLKHARRTCQAARAILGIAEVVSRTSQIGWSLSPSVI